MLAAPSSSASSGAALAVPRPVLMDFGLARETTDSPGLTESGAVLGTVKQDRAQRRDGLQQTGSFYAANRAVRSVTALLGGAAM